MKNALMLAMTIMSTHTFAGSNDECSGAVPLTVNAACVPTNGDLSLATQSMAPISCGNFTSDSANDLWYTFTAATTTTSIQVTGGAQIDAIIEVFSGDCSSLVSIGCADSSLLGGTETANLPTNIGGAYLVRVYFWEYPTPPTDFSFTICAFEGVAPPANDLCGSITAEALAAGSSLTFAGDNTGALISGDYEAGSTLAPYNYASVWHAFTTTECTDVTISYCGTSPSFDLFWLLVAATCPASDSLVFATTADTTGCANNQSMTFEELPAGTWYIPVLSAAGSTGPYSMTVSATACAVGIVEGGSDPSLSVFPNPSDGNFTLVWNGAQGKASIALVDAAGRTVQAEQVFLGHGVAHPVVVKGSVAPGSYLVVVMMADRVVRQRITVH